MTPLAGLTQLKTLDLSRNKLTDVTPLAGLTQLTKLDLSENQISTLPNIFIEQDFEIAWKTGDFNGINLRDNPLTTPPLEIFKRGKKAIHEYCRLSKLGLAQIFRHFLATGKKFKEREFDALKSDNGYALNFLGQVIGLNVRSMEFKKLDFVSISEHLVFLDASNNELTDVTPLAGLTNLTWLDLSHNQLTDVTALAALTQLTKLDVSRNQVTDAHPLAGLSELTTLKLNDNRLTDVTALAALTQLTKLDVSRNQLTNARPLAGLTQLTVLNLSYNKLRDVTPLADLTQLKELNLQSTLLRDVTPLIGLTQLTTLDVSFNPLRDVTPFADLTQVTTLNLSNNRLTDVTSLAGLTQLRWLNLSDNQLTDVTPLAGLTQLTILNLRNNQITILPEAFLERESEIVWKDDYISDVINLFDNPLTTPPPEIVKQGNEAIREYFRQQREAGQDYLYEAKLLIVGEPGAGKTTFAQKMLNAAYQLQPDEVSTQGINVLQWEFPLPLLDESGNPPLTPPKRGKTFRVNIWDFGGQEIYKATHQFFLTKRSLYVLVADNRKEDTDFYYWLNIVALLSDNSPVIILKNEKQDRVRELPERELRGEFTNLKEMLPANLATNRGLSTVMDTARHYLTHLPHVGSVLPKTWVNVRNALEQDRRNYITVEEYYRICEQHNFTRRDDQLQLSGYLHDLGVCLHFQDDDLLRKTVILKPEWGTAAVYHVLDNPTVIAHLGCFTKDDLKTIWQAGDYDDMRGELLRLMMKFQLCYEIPGCAGQYIAPQLLSENAPDYSWNNDENLRVRYAYEFMPKGMLTRFIVAAHPFIEDQRLVWKSGVVLQDDGTRAEIIEYYGKREIQIRVSGKDKRGLLTIVMHEFRKIHGVYSRLKYDTLIPCNCAACQASAELHFYEFDMLKEFLANRQNDIQCRKKPYHMVNVRGLLDDVFVTPPESPKQAEERINELKEQLRDTAPGSEEERRIRREIEQLSARAR